MEIRWCVRISRKSLKGVRGGSTLKNFYLDCNETDKEVVALLAVREE